AYHRRRDAGRGAPRSEGARGVSRRSPSMTVAASEPAPSAATVDAAYFSCRDLHAYYGESYVVQGVSLEVREGEILALLGRNGAGKTSTLRCIARTDSPALTRGEIRLAGKPLQGLRAFEAAQAGGQPLPEDPPPIG